MTRTPPTENTVPTSIPPDWDDTGPEPEDPTFDIEEDPLMIDVDLAETDEDLLADGFDSDRLDITVAESSPTPADTDLENALVEFVDRFNARDMEGLSELFAPEATFDLTESLAPGSLDDLFLRHPDLILTRGELDLSPVAAAWILDADTDHYRLCGLFVLEIEEGLIERIVFVDEVPEGDLVVETPDDTERPEWEDWSAQDET